MGGWYRFGYITAQIIGKTLFSFKVVHRERIIEKGGVILAMNHESYIDPPLAGIACHRELFYLARKTLLQWPVLGPILPHMNVIPVDQERADMSALKAGKAEVNVAGSGNATFASDGEVEANIMGSGDVTVRGRARCKVKTIGSGSLVCEGGSEGADKAA